MKNNNFHSIFENEKINTKIMLSIVGTYQNGYLKLDKDYSSVNPVKVIVTFLEEVQSESKMGCL